MPRNETVAIWWIRRDLRLADNQALVGAAARATRVLPVFVADPHLLDPIVHGGAERRCGFLWSGLRALDADLRRRGSRLTVRRGRPAAVLRDLVERTGATAVVAEADVTPYGRRRDRSVADVVPLTTTPGLTVQPPGEQRTTTDTPYAVFTPFKRRWLAAPLPEPRDLSSAPRCLAAPPDLPSDPIPPGRGPEAFPASETEAHRRLDCFTRGDDAPIHRYDERRDRIDLDGTSVLSPYLRFGMLSARRAVVAALALGAAEEPKSGPGVWLSELVWREFHLGILRNFPRVLHGAFDEALAGVAWRDDPSGLAAWQQGRTGYPIVDAAMRQLAQTGWMHNRARMITASFLVKDLLIDWRHGERWFMRHLVDGDPAANNGGWQWTAGTGTDAAPYFRIFNPVRQGARADPEGDYVRRWVPELRGVAGAAVHAPWRLPRRELEERGVRLGRDYPGPIVDHQAARDRTLAVYESARAAARSRATTRP